ncbi:MAG: ECF transporter S component [Candidatus Bathyarchaeia archaeon]
MIDLKFGTRELAASAIMGALVAVTTILIQVPIPATEGFFNIGDAMVMVAALTFGPIVGAMAGGIGSALADFIGGWYVWVPFTLTIKGLEGFIAGYIMRSGGRLTPSRLVLAWFIGGLEMVVGYFLVQVYMYGFNAALVEAPFNLVQMAAAGVVGIPLTLALRRRVGIDLLSSR